MADRERRTGRRPFDTVCPITSNLSTRNNAANRERAARPHGLS